MIKKLFINIIENCIHYQSAENIFKLSFKPNFFFNCYIVLIDEIPYFREKMSKLPKTTNYEKNKNKFKRVKMHARSNASFIFCKWRPSHFLDGYANVLLKEHF